LLTREAVFVLDFDRGKRQPRGAWEHQVLARLLRSLEKLKSQNPALHFTTADWQALIEGYREGVDLRVDG
jgi:hypothetical protein